MLHLAVALELLERLGHVILLDALGLGQQVGPHLVLHRTVALELLGLRQLLGQRRQVGQHLKLRLAVALELLGVRQRAGQHPVLHLAVAHEFLEELGHVAVC